MRSWICALALLLESICGVAALSCRDKGVHMAESFSAKDDLGCVLQVWAGRAGSEELEVSYIFTNGSIRTVYLFNKLYTEYSDQGLYVTDPQLVNVVVENGKVVLSKKIVSVPPRMKVERPNIPCVTKVPAGSNVQEIIRLRLPLKIWTPYTDDSLPMQPQPVDKRLYFAIGYFLSTPEGDSMVQTVRTSDGPALYFYPFSIGSQKILEAGPASFPIPVFTP